MILGWRSPINPLNSGQPQPRIWCSTGQYVLFVTTITAGRGHGAAEQRWSDQSQGGHVGQTSDIWSHFTTPHLHNVNNHNKHEHIPQLNVFWILLTLCQYYSIFSLGNKEGDRSGPHAYQLIYTRCINNPAASCCFAYMSFISGRHI